MTVFEGRVDFLLIVAGGGSWEAAAKTGGEDVHVDCFK